MRGTVPLTAPVVASPSLKLPTRRAERASGRCAIPSPKLPTRRSAAPRSERVSPSLKRPTRRTEGVSGVRSMPSLNRGRSGVEGTYEVVGTSWWEVMVHSLLCSVHPPDRLFWTRWPVNRDRRATGDGRQCAVLCISAPAVAHCG
jgi:hypothetical protein